MRVVVDKNEKKCFLDVLGKYVEYKVESKDVGDIHIMDGERSVVIIERKTVDDLAASLNDGRYHEQKTRLKSIKEGRVLYLIEGEYRVNSYNKTFNLEKFKGCSINTIVRDNIGVFFTKNMEETGQLILDIFKRVPKYRDVLMGGGGKEEYYENIKIKKRDNVTGKVCFINQLRQIPGVSIPMAEVIREKYENMGKLIGGYNGLSTEKEKQIMLRDLKVNNRKIGPVVSKRVYEYLMI